MVDKIHGRLLLSLKNLQACNHVTLHSKTDEKVELWLQPQERRYGLARYLDICDINNDLTNVNRRQPFLPEMF